ncbi:hypothetical protein L1987_08440 [Smallanthus sonchifolius]|uniref:Uncharacterized protein n=1 Tax=Smallanthus sonchifolius TaxID=185202 RepID=A0ACB9JKP2_9ASTR|nr:hypothetical protein L1987_08440 [Smallanthus sonchifolius]
MKCSRVPIFLSPFFVLILKFWVPRALVNFTLLFRNRFPSPSSILSRSDPKITLQFKAEIMGRGVSSGGGQSSLDYLFGSGGESKPATVSAEAAPSEVQVAATTELPAKPAVAVTQQDIAKQIPAGVQSSKLNNYIRADGQNTGNFLTDRPSTKVHAAPGGGSSLGYLFGDGSN